MLDRQGTTTNLSSAAPQVSQAFDNELHVLGGWVVVVVVVVGVGVGGLSNLHPACPKVTSSPLDDSTPKVSTPRHGLTDQAVVRSHLFYSGHPRRPPYLCYQVCTSACSTSVPYCVLTCCCCVCCCCSVQCWDQHSAAHTAVYPGGARPVGWEHTMAGCLGSSADR
jgi:hypothetical protein